MKIIVILSRQIEASEQTALVDEFSVGAARRKRPRLREAGNPAAGHRCTAAPHQMRTTSGRHRGGTPTR